jgi:hypothetical protein
MSAVDDKVDRVADRLEEASKKAALSGGIKAKLAQPLAEDADFVRKLKPSLIAARARGAESTDGRATQATPPVRPQPKAKRSERGGPSPFVVVGAAFAAGLVLAHALDWLGHRYPRA